MMITCFKHTHSHTRTVCECTRAITSLDLIKNVLYEFTVKITVMKTVAFLPAKEDFLTEMENTSQT